MKFELARTHWLHEQLDTIGGPTLQATVQRNNNGGPVARQIRRKEIFGGGWVLRFYRWQVHQAFSVVRGPF